MSALYSPPLAAVVWRAIAGGFSHADPIGGLAINCFPKSAACSESQSRSSPPPFFLPPFVPFFFSLRLHWSTTVWCSGVQWLSVLHEIYFPGCYAQLPLILKYNASQNIFFLFWDSLTQMHNPQLALPWPSEDMWLGKLSQRSTLVRLHIFGCVKSEFQQHSVRLVST